MEAEGTSRKRGGRRKAAEEMPRVAGGAGMEEPKGGSEMPASSVAGSAAMPEESGGNMPEPEERADMPEPEGGGTMPEAGGGQAPQGDGPAPGGPGRQPDEGGLQQVLVEMRVPRERGTQFALQAAAELDVSGFQVDTGYDPVPISPRTDDARQLRAADEEVVLIRGQVAPGRIQEIESLPNVVRVYPDTPIAPFAAQLLLEEGTFVLPGQGLGTCAISPCDCSPGTAKGTIADVATYLGCDQVWAGGIKGKGVVVAVVDGGITAVGRTPRPGETAKIPRVIGGWPADWGTTAAAWGDHGNMCGTDVLGMAPEAELYDIRISAGTLQATISAAISGYQWCIGQHQANGTPQVMTNSWGIFQDTWDSIYAVDPNHPFTRKVVEALDEGILVLFAAGNCGEACPDGRCGGDIGPGNSIWGANGHPRVMTVAAVNKNEQYVGYSSQGPAALDPRKPDFASITHFKGYFPSDSGTSAATPIAAGVVALLKQAAPGLTQAQAKKALMDTAKDIGPAGWDQHTGAGIIRAKAAFDSSLRAGRLEIFARGTDHGLWHQWQTAPNNGWSGWASLGGWIDRPFMGRNADGRLEAFVIGSDHALWHKWQTSPGGAWSGWASLGGLIDLLTVGQNADGRLEVFARGMDGAVWHKWQTAPNNGWSGWASLGGVIDLLVTGRNADGRIEIFARGMDGAVWHKWQTAPNNGWSGWASLGGIVDLLAVGQNADGRLEIFARGMDGAVWAKWQTAPNNGWSGWASHGGVIDQLAVGRNADGRLEVFARGMDQALWHKWQVAPNNGWSGWASLGGWIDQPVVSRNADGRIEVFVIGSDHAVWHKWQVAPNNGWSGWASRGGIVDLLAVAQNAG